MSKQRLVVFSIVLSAFFFVLGMIVMNSIDHLPTSAKDSANNSSILDKSKSNSNLEKEGQEALTADGALKSEQASEKMTKKSSDPAGSSAEMANQSGYLIDVDISDQKVYIYENGELVQEWIVSTGIKDYTPIGNFTIQNRGEWFFSEKYQQGAKWWVSYKDWGVYLFHSLPMDREQNILAEEAEKLGTPASHGCVRLEEENSKWIYDNIPQGTPVNIHE